MRKGTKIGVGVVSLIVTANLVGVGTLYASANMVPNVEPAVLDTFEGVNLDVTSYSDAYVQQEEMNNLSAEQLMEVPAKKALTGIIASFPTGTSWVAEPTTLSTVPFNAVCPVSETEPRPVMSEQLSLSPAQIAPQPPPAPANGTTENTGGTAPQVPPPVPVEAGGYAQTSVYLPGLAEKAMQDMRERLNNCKAVWGGGNNLPFDSFTVYDGGSPFGGGSPGSTTFIRSGDMIGAVSVRGVGNSQNLASEWGKTWGTYLTPDVCPNVDDSVTSAPARNPLAVNYEGLKVEEEARLSAEEKISTKISGIVTLRLKETEGKKIEDNGSVTLTSEDFSLPDIEKFNLPEYPSYLSVQIPSEPAKVEKPLPPPDPTEAALFTYPKEDTVGPGCGWSFTGMTPPLFDDAVAEKTKQDNRFAIMQQLKTAQKGWFFNLWEFKLLKSEYLAYQKALDLWRLTAVNAISTAWWNDYDTKMRRYNVDYAKWQADYLLWQTDYPECSIYYPSVETFSNDILENETYLVEKIRTRMGTSAGVKTRVNIFTETLNEENPTPEEPEPPTNPTPEPTTPQPPQPPPPPPNPTPSPTFNPPNPQPSPNQTNPTPQPSRTPYQEPEIIIPDCPAPPKKPSMPKKPDLPRVTQQPEQNPTPTS